MTPDTDDCQLSLDENHQKAWRH